MLSMAAHRIGNRRNRNLPATDPLAQRAVLMGRCVGRDRALPVIDNKWLELKGCFGDIVELDSTTAMRGAKQKSSRYALIISISAPRQNVDLYSEITALVEAKEIEVLIG